MFDDATMKEIATVARGLQVEPAALAAVAHIESGLKTHAIVDGRMEPLIRFEGHYFDRRLAGQKRERARREKLASPRAGAVANPASQTARWKLLARAAEIDRAAAYESVSWGIGQVMGAHWAWLGYASVDALVEEARAGAGGQLRLMGRFIARAALADALRRHDWAAFARGYNGPAYRRNDYDGKLARTYARYARALATASSSAAPVSPGDAPAVLRRGARGEPVRTLQQALAAQGHALRPDGVFGPATERAVRDYQQRNGLVVDGVAGPATFAALRRPGRSTVAGWIGSVLERLRPRHGSAGARR